MQIDVDQTLRSRVPRLHRWMPRWLVRRLEKVVCQDEMNEMLAIAGHRRGSEFCRAVLDHLDVKVVVSGVNNIDSVIGDRLLFISNHPLGGLDGIALIDFVRRMTGKEPRFIVNDLLMAIEPLGDVFVPINKHGAQSRDAVRRVDEAFAGDRPVIIFPAGLVSRRGRNGVIADLKWQKMFVIKAKQAGRIIIPLYFEGENSSFFYKFAKWRKRLGIKFNLEMIRLPREVFKARGSRFALYVGQPVASQDVMGRDETASQAAERFREVVYNLKPKCGS